jgi:hypothetical protein
VLLYQVARFRNPERQDLKEQMRAVFDQHSEMTHDGFLTGGAGKLACLREGPLGWSVFYKTPCKEIIEELRALFRDFYLHIPTQETRDPEIVEAYTTRRDDDPRVQDAAKKLSSSEWMVQMIETHLSSKWEVVDDGSLENTILRPDSRASSSRRKRKGGVPEELTPQKRRMGQLPPRHPQPQRGLVWSQGTHSCSLTRSGTLFGSSSPSATRVLTGSRQSLCYDSSCSNVVPEVEDSQDVL